MQTAHETCHICRRQCPDKHVYYRDYEELERHFRKDHHACLHPECLAKKFVVFTSAQELKNHEGLEHGRAMTKAERQAALRVDVGFTVGDNGGGNQPGERTAVGISGRGPGANNATDVERMRAQARAHAQEQLRQARVNSVESAQLEAVLRASRGDAELPRVASAEDFPDLASNGGELDRGGLIGGGWAGRAGSGRSSPGLLSVSGGSVGRNLDDAEAFPTLGGANPTPGLKKQPRHMQPRGGNPAGSAKRAAPMPRAPREVLAARLQGPGDAGAAGAAVRVGSFGPAGSAPPSLASDEEHFPSLPAGPTRPANSFAAPPGFNADGEATAPFAAPPARDVSIGGFERVVSKRGKGRWSAADGGLAASAPTSTPTPSRPSKKAQAKAEEDAAAKEAAAASEVAARSDALVARVRRTLDAKGGSFNSFASLSSQFKNGQCSASSYVAKLRVMGLDLAIVNELAALMPDGDKRGELERAAAAAARLMGGGGGGGDSLGEAAAILFGAKQTRDEDAWDCPACTFHNAGGNVRCDVCDGCARRGGRPVAGGGAVPAARAFRAGGGGRRQKGCQGEEGFPHHCRGGMSRHRRHCRPRTVVAECVGSLDSVIIHHERVHTADRVQVSP